jgi:hemoglobin
MARASIYEFAGGDQAFLELDDPDLRAALRSYMEWATQDVLAYAPADSHVPADMPVLRWSWDGPE